MDEIVDTLDRRTCLDEIKINRYILHQCSTKERQGIESHLRKCSLCRYEVICLTKAQSEIQNEKRWEELPEHLYLKGMEIVKEMKEAPVKASALEICLRLIGERWKIVRHTGIMISQPVLAARGKIPGKKKKISTIVKEFNGFRVEVDIKADKEGTLDLFIRVKSFDDYSLIQKVMFTLMDEKKQKILEKSTQDGEITFEGLEPGAYSIHITHKERRIGEIKLDLR